MRLVGVEARDSLGDRVEDGVLDGRIVRQERVELAVARRRATGTPRCRWPSPSAGPCPASRAPRRSRPGPRSARRSAGALDAHRVPSMITKNSSPVVPSRATTRPSGRSTSSASRPTSSSSLRSRPASNGTLESSVSFSSIVAIRPPVGLGARAGTRVAAAYALRVRPKRRDVAHRSRHRAGYAPPMPRIGDGRNLAFAALRTTLDDRELRRLTVTWLAVNAGKWAFLVTTLLAAYQAGRLGGGRPARAWPVSSSRPSSRPSPGCPPSAGGRRSCCAR